MKYMLKRLGFALVTAGMMLPGGASADSIPAQILDLNRYGIYSPPLGA